MLKRKLTKAEYDKLSEDLQSEYKEEGDNYILEVEGFDDPAELRRARDRERQDRLKAQRELKAATERLEELDGNDARKSGDIDKIEKGWKEKLEQKETELGGKLTKLEAATKRRLIDAAAIEMASKISTVPTLMATKIAERLTVEFDDGEPILKVLGKDGKAVAEASEKALEHLRKEFVDNKEFAAIIIGTKASGGGATERKERKTGSGAPASENEPDYMRMTPKELAESMRQVKEASTE